MCRLCTMACRGPEFKHWGLYEATVTLLILHQEDLFHPVGEFCFSQLRPSQSQSCLFLTPPQLDAVSVMTPSASRSLYPQRLVHEPTCSDFLDLIVS